jgi:hypothetical protein
MLLVMMTPSFRRRPARPAVANPDVPEMPGPHQFPRSDTTKKSSAWEERPMVKTGCRAYRQFELRFRPGNCAYVHRETVGFRLLGQRTPPGNRRCAYYIDLRDVDAPHVRLLLRDERHTDARDVGRQRLD